MRVSSSQLSELVLQGLQRQDREYAKLMTQMSSGYRINNISENPLGSITLLGLAREQSSFKQYGDNIQRVISQLEKAESYLNTSFDVLLRIQDLTLSATNGSATPDDRKALAQELVTLRDTLIDFANARDEEGNYLFGGSRLDTPPVDPAGSGYQGDNLTRQVPVAQGVTLSINETIESVYFQGGNFFTDLNNFIDDLENDNSGLATSGPALLNGLQRTIDGLNQKLTVVGSRILSARSLGSAQEDLALANEKIRGSIQDLDYIDAMGRVNRIELALTTTQKTYSRLSQLSLFDYF